jgi:hypothetical protein
MGFGAAFFWALANCFVENGLVPSVEKKKKKKKHNIWPEFQGQLRTTRPTSKKKERIYQCPAARW